MNIYIIAAAIIVVILIVAALFVLAFSGLAVLLAKSITKTAVESAKPNITIYGSQSNRITEQILEIIGNLSASLTPKLFEQDKEHRSDKKKELE